jgi:DNA-binding transcriptional LysR family regulator
MDVQALRTFVEVARRRGFTRASEALHVTQPAVSKVVRALEEELGTPLLVRERRTVSLTEAGRMVLERAQGILDALRGIEEEVVEIAALRRGRLRIGFPPIVGVAFFPPLLAEFHTAYPGIVLELREEGSHHIEALVASRELDVGAVVLPTDEEAFGTMPFVHEDLRAVLHPSHPLARRESLALRELAGTPFVLYRPEFALHGHILEACRRAGFKPHVASESSHWDFIVAMVAANIGVALLPGTICRQLDPEQVRSVAMTKPLIPWDVALVWRRDRHLPPATRAWLDLARKRLLAGALTPRARRASATRRPCRWNTRTIAITGTVTTTAAAAMAAAGCWNCEAPPKKASAAGTGRARSVEVSEIPKTKSFQAARKARIAAVNTPGAASGKVTWRNTCQGVAPSTWAASSTSHGISRKCAERTQSDRGSEKERYGRTSPAQVSYSPSARQRSKSGPTMATTGNIAIASAVASTSPRPRNSSRASA